MLSPRNTTVSPSSRAKSASAAGPARRAATRRRGDALIEASVVTVGRGRYTDTSKARAARVIVWRKAKRCHPAPASCFGGRPRMFTTGLVALVLTAPAAGDDAKAIAFFESRIRPVLAENCYQCHSARSGKSSG